MQERSKASGTVFSHVKDINLVHMGRGEDMFCSIGVGVRCTMNVRMEYQNIQIQCQIL